MVKFGKEISLPIKRGLSDQISNLSEDYGAVREIHEEISKLL